VWVLGGLAYWGMVSLVLLPLTMSHFMMLAYIAYAVVCSCLSGCLGIRLSMSGMNFGLFLRHQVYSMGRLASSHLQPSAKLALVVIMRMHTSACVNSIDWHQCVDVITMWSFLSLVLTTGLYTSMSRFSMVSVIPTMGMVAMLDRY